jgi:hypothetical protein
VRIVLDFDDLHWREPENCLDTINLLVNSIENIKINFFTIPFLDYIPLIDNSKWCLEIERLIKYGKIRLYVHGLRHSFNEFLDISYEGAIKKIDVAEQIFYASNLRFGKVFKGPNWGINKETIRALIDKKYDYIYVHPEQEALATEFCQYIKFITYNFNLSDLNKTRPDKDLTIMHGHTHNVCGNGIKEISNDLINFCREEKPTFKFIEEIW